MGLLEVLIVEKSRLHSLTLPNRVVSVMKQITSPVPGFVSAWICGNREIARIISTVDPGKGLSVGTPDAVSRGTDRWAVDLLQRGGPKKCADASFTTRISLFIEDV